MKRWADEVFTPGPPAPLPWPAETVIAALTPVALPARVARIERAVAGRMRSVVAVIESLSDPHNAAAILRTCDGLGVHEVHAIERDATVQVTTRVSKGCEKWMDLRRHATAKSCAETLHAQGYVLLVADMRATESWARLREFPRVALAFGNEHLGIGAELRAVADGAFAIPMRGMVESFNVSVAAAIALAEATRDRAGDLGTREQQELQARFLMESVREPELVVERYMRDHGVGGR